MAKDPNLSTTDDLAQGPDPLDHDGDGRKGGSKPKIGAVVRAGKAPPSAADLGDDPNKPVRARITIKGAGRVHDGDGGRYEANDEVVLPLGVARDLQGDPQDKNAKGFAEIVGTYDE